MFGYFVKSVLDCGSIGSESARALRREMGKNENVLLLVSYRI